MMIRTCRTESESIKSHLPAVQTF
eukprot:SAG22_NODE_1571_length_4095_cov_2.849099_6_plen_23_part_01